MVSFFHLLPQDSGLDHTTYLHINSECTISDTVKCRTLVRWYQGNCPLSLTFQETDSFHWCHLLEFFFIYKRLTYWAYEDLKFLILHKYLAIYRFSKASFWLLSSTVIKVCLGYTSSAQKLIKAHEPKRCILFSCWQTNFNV